MSLTISLRPSTVQAPLGHWLCGLMLAVAAPSPAHAGGAAEGGGACVLKLVNDHLLQKPAVTTRSDHQLIVHNREAWPAFIKMVSAKTSATWLFFVEKGGTASITNIPDGSYSVRYALGGFLAADCRTVLEPVRAGEFPRGPTFITELQQTSEGTLVNTTTDSFTLSSVASGQGEARYIPVDAFNAR